MRRVVSLFLPTWPTDRIRRRTDLSRDKPLVTARKQGARRVVAAVDEAARRHGLKPGMTVADAQTFVPDLTVTEADPSGDDAALAGLAAWAVRRYSPIASPDAPDGILIDSTGCDHLFGGEHAMLADMHACLRRARISVRGAVADTPGAAHAVARVLADPIRIVAQGGTEQALRPLPVAALRLPQEIVAGLFDLGFKEIGQVLDAPRSALAVRFGAVVGQKLAWALGATPELVVPYVPEDLPRQRLVFAEPLASPASLERAARDLAKQIAADLERRAMGARRLDLLFERVDNSIQAIRVGLAQASRNPDHLMGLLRGRLETIDPGFGIDAASLIAAQVERLPSQQIATVLSDIAPETDISELVDRLASLPAVRQVLRFAPVESDLPQRSVQRLQALAPPGGQTWPAWPRPTRLIDPPELIAAIPPDAPDLFVWRGRTH
ncbi:MAG TPA: DNA polymerase Y family protein, partial [Beijerinckiaceae bacterium]|nr:DNA polymerase Y family protein [Beijerinckiaceae bacterium]